MQRHLFTKILFFGLLLLSFWVGIKLILPIALPFLLAGALALGAESGVSWLHQKWKLPRPAASAIGVTALFVLFLTVLILVLAFLWRQLPKLSGLIPQIQQAILSGRMLLQDWLLSLAQRLPGSLGEAISGWASDLLSGSKSLITPLLQRLADFLGSLVGKVSQGMFSLLTALIASYMISARLPQLRALVPESARESLREFRRGLGFWLLAQLKLAGLTFGVLLPGFWLLRIGKPVLWAFLITLVDAFPILGVGTVLLPWALVALLQGENALALGLLGLYAAAWLLRQVAEPRLVGSSIGLDPLLTLAAMYAGFQFGGILGLILSPLLTMLALQVWKTIR